MTVSDGPSNGFPNMAQISPLATEFVCITVPLATSGPQLRDTIETQLRDYGDPLRWAITSVEDATAHVEAVVTVAADPS
ncbi:MAG: hypothetical protein ACFB2W_03925 [Leptolyngbyaceae cyanobacterium]